MYFSFKAVEIICFESSSMPTPLNDDTKKKPFICGYFFFKRSTGKSYLFTWSIWVPIMKMGQSGAWQSIELSQKSKPECSAPSLTYKKRFYNRFKLLY